VDQLHLYVGDMDTYYLNEGVVELEAWMKTTQSPHYEGSFMYGWRKPHCWSGPVSGAERLKEMAQQVKRHVPDGVETEWWRYYPRLQGNFGRSRALDRDLIRP
jgi:hypothetical protein